MTLLVDADVPGRSPKAHSVRLYRPDGCATMGSSIFNYAFPIWMERERFNRSGTAGNGLCTPFQWRRQRHHAGRARPG